MLQISNILAELVEYVGGDVWVSGSVSRGTNGIDSDIDVSTFYSDVRDRLRDFAYNHPEYRLDVVIPTVGCRMINMDGSLGEPETYEDLKRLRKHSPITQSQLLNKL